MIQQVEVAEYKGRGTLRSLVYMWQHEGMRGLLKGNGVNVLRIGPFSAFEMFFYDFYKYNLFGGEEASKVNKLICASMTGATASFLTYPLDMVRTLMAINVQDAGAKKSMSIAGCIKEIYTTKGVGGFYRGLPATLVVSGNLIEFN